jgi:hypothetical protein
MEEFISNADENVKFAKDFEKRKLIWVVWDQAEKDLQGDMLAIAST